MFNEGDKVRGARGKREGVVVDPQYAGGYVLVRWEGKSGLEIVHIRNLRLVSAVAV